MASGSTANYFIPYPLSTDPVLISSDMEDLAVAVDMVLNTLVPQTISTSSTPTFSGINLVGGDLYLGIGRNIIFEGSLADDFETKISVVNPTADRTINFPDEDGTVVLSSSGIISIDTANITTANVVGSSITLLSSVTSSPTSNATITVNRGTLNDVSIRWNESNDAWEYTNDGVVYNEIGSGGTGGGSDISDIINGSLLLAGM